MKNLTNFIGKNEEFPSKKISKENKLVINAIKELHLEAEKMSKEAAIMVFDALEKNVVSSIVKNSKKWKYWKNRFTAGK